MGTIWNDMPGLQNNKYIPPGFHKNVFWMIIQFPAIIHSYNQDYADRSFSDKLINAVLTQIYHLRFEITNQQSYAYL